MAGKDGARIAQAIHEAYNNRNFAQSEEQIAEDFAWTFIAFGATSRGVERYRGSCKHGPRVSLIPGWTRRA